MSYTFSSMIRLFLIQCLLTMILAMPFQEANAEVKTTKVNTYIYEGDSVDLKSELMLEEDENVKGLKIRAQGIEEDAKLNVIINDEVAHTVNLADSMKTSKLKIGKKVKSLTVSSKGAFIRSVGAKIESVISDEPHPEDIGRRTLFARLFR